ncbi:MAG: putative integral membrane [Desulfobulbaceae bacterium]|jgi:TolB-like protein|nr:MAG: putative integral membrane [Desulfobulbaceae bacterium]
MMNHPFIFFSRLFLSLALPFCVAGCSTFNCTPFEKHLGAEQNLITLAAQIAEDLTQQAMPPLMPRQTELPILTTTFVNNDNLKETSRFGRILQEHITSRLVQLNYSVQEIKLRETLLMREQSGEIMLSRSLQDITQQKTLSPQAILVGTYSYTERVMYISARLINPKDRNIISSTDYRLCMDDNVLAMFGLKRQSAGAGDEIAPPRESLLDALFY